MKTKQLDWTEQIEVNQEWKKWFPNWHRKGPVSIKRLSWNYNRKILKDHLEMFRPYKSIVGGGTHNQEQ